MDDNEFDKLIEDSGIKKDDIKNYLNSVEHKSQKDIIMAKISTKNSMETVVSRFFLIILFLTSILIISEFYIFLKSIDLKFVLDILYISKNSLFRFLNILAINIYIIIIAFIIKHLKKQGGFQNE